MGCCQSRQQRQRPGSTDHGNAADARRSSVAAYVQDQHGAIDNGRSAHPNAARQASRSSATAQLPSQTPITGAATTNGTAPETPGTLSTYLTNPTTNSAPLTTAHQHQHPHTTHPSSRPSPPPPSTPAVPWKPRNRPLKPFLWRERRGYDRAANREIRARWTRAALEREREAFFDTRVTGREEVWAALRMVGEEMRAGNLESAQGILDAVGVTTPRGDLVDGCYDASGVSYRLAPVVVGEPPVVFEEEVSEDGEVGEEESDTMGEEEDGKDDGDGDGDGGETANEEDGDVEVEVEKRREAKAKAKAKGKSADGSANTVDVRLRLSDALKDITLTVRKDQRVFAIERQLRSECEIPPTARIYMLHQGKLLRSHQSLLDQGWVVGNVVNVFVARDPQDA